MRPKAPHGRVLLNLGNLEQSQVAAAFVAQLVREGVGFNAYSDLTHPGEPPDSGEESVLVIDFTGAF